MPCKSITDGQGHAYGIACGKGMRRQKCGWCESPATRLCDYVAHRGHKKEKPCDAPMCSAHATVKGPNLDHCPTHKDYNQEALIL